MLERSTAGSPTSGKAYFGNMLPCLPDVPAVLVRCDILEATLHFFCLPLSRPLFCSSPKTLAAHEDMGKIQALGPQKTGPAGRCIGMSVCYRAYHINPIHTMVVIRRGALPTTQLDAIVNVSLSNVCCTWDGSRCCFCCCRVAVVFVRIPAARRFTFWPNSLCHDRCLSASPSSIIVPNKQVVVTS